MPSSNVFDPTNYTSLLMDGSPRWHSGNGSVTYSLLTEVPNYYLNANNTGYEIDEYDFGLNADPTLDATAEMMAQLSVMRLNEVANVNLIEATGNTLGDVTFGDLEFDDEFLFGFAYGPEGPDFSGDIWLNSTMPIVDNPEFYDEGWVTFIHELGHAIGLDHPFDGVRLPSSLDNSLYTVMSYDPIPVQAGVNAQDRQFPATPMLYDIQALQSLYGANMATRTGDDVYFASAGGDYEIADGDTLFATIWDAGGNDTFSGANQTSDVNIDLRPGYFSTIGASEGNIGIALGVDGTRAMSAAIENAVGGSGNDTLRGNTLDNILTGGLGNDELRGGGGDDVLEGGGGDDMLKGGLGTDTAFYVEERSRYTVIQTSGNIYSITSETGEIDTLSNIERVEFSDGNFDIIDLNSADFDLSIGVVEAGKYGNKYDGATDSVVSASFTGTDSTLMLSFDGFDIDFANELEVLVNGASLGFVDAGVNNDLASYTVAIAAENQITGENTLEFRQSVNPAYKWGITDIVLEDLFDFDLTVGVAEAGKYGNKYDGATDADGVVSASFTGTDSTLMLSFDGFDIDFANELEILVNGDSLGFVDAGVNNDLASYTVAIAAEAQLAGENTLEFRQSVNPAYKWGITDIVLEDLFDFDLTVGAAEAGKYGNKYDGAMDTDGVVSASFTGAGSDLTLSFDGFDIDFANELEILVNGDSLGFVDAGVNNDLASYTVAIAAEAQIVGENTLEFRQSVNPAYKWGITDILIDDVIV